LSDKTESPTPRRLRKARDEGDSGASPYASQALAFVVAVALAPSAVRALAARAGDDLRVAIARAASRFDSGPTVGGMDIDSIGLARTLLSLSLPLVAAVGVTAALAHAVQTGGVISTSRLAPSLDRLDPVAGTKRLFSGQRLLSVARALVASLVIGWIAYDALRAHVVDWARIAGRPKWIAVAVSDAAGALAGRTALVGLLLAAVDLLVTRRAWLRRLRMTKDEVRREHRESEGDPQVKAARERAYHEMLSQATVANVKNATVVVVNPTHRACALRYDAARGDEAPLVLATGEGSLAARIAQAARDLGVPIVRDVALAGALVELEPGDVIPEVLYEAVAQILRELDSRPPGT
jgi:flagellar biosynthetic protein FlhB